MINNKLLLKVAVIILPLWALYNFLSGNSSIINQFKIYKSNENHLVIIDSLNTVKKNLDLERAKLRHDTLYLEKVVRMELGMAKPEEKVYRLFEEKRSTE